MLCPKCNNPMHQSSIGLLVCLKCGYSQQPEGSTPFVHTEAPTEVPVASIAPAEHYDVEEPQTYQADSEIAESPERLTINDFIVDEPPQKRRLADLAIVKNISNLDAKQKKILLAGFVSIFVISIAGSFLTFQDYQASALLKQGVTLNQSSQFELASAKLNNAKNHIKFPSTKKAIEKEIANNKRWMEFKKIQIQAEDLIAQQKFSEALDLLYQISDDYPAYDSIQKDIALAESEQTTDTSVSVLSDSESSELIDGELSIGTEDYDADFGFSFGDVSYDDSGFGGGFDGGGFDGGGFDDGGPIDIDPDPITPPPIVPPVVPPVVTPVVRPNPIIKSPCQVTVASQFMDLYNTAVNIASYCSQKFATIESKLIKSPYSAPHKIVFTNDANSTSGNTVYLNAANYRSSPSNMGPAIYQLAQVAQAYKSASVWNKEALSAYVKIEIVDSGNGFYCAAGYKLNTSSRCGASFLKWAHNKYGSTFWNSLQNQLRDGSYSDTNFWGTAKTGNKTLRENYALCRNTSYCSGGIAW